ncbi:hypothetical protein [Microcystis phage Mae-Yong1326-1]|nr:hypothetical protein [Microcystis phage Mae-Yong1326-1]
MCRLPGPKIDTTAQRQAQREAEEARAAEAARQQRIQQGRAKVDQAFAGFDDNFFAGRRQAVLDYYEPELTKQFNDARRQMEFALARAGLTKSSEAGRQMGNLNDRFQVASADVARRAEDAVSRLRADVDNQRAGVISQLEATADPSGAANAALSRSKVLQGARIGFDPLGDIFAGAAGTIGSVVQGQRDNDIRQLALGASRPGGNSRGPGFYTVRQ